MKLLGVEPDLESYNHLLTVYAKKGEIDKAEEVLALGN